MLSFSFNLIVSTDIRLTLTDMTDFNWYHDTEKLTMKLLNVWLSYNKEPNVSLLTRKFKLFQGDGTCQKYEPSPFGTRRTFMTKAKKINSNIFLSLNIHQNEL